MKKIMIILGCALILFFSVLLILYNARIMTPPKLMFRKHDQTESVSEEEEQINKVIDRAVRMLNTEYKNAEIKSRYDPQGDYCYFDVLDPRFDGDFVKSAEEGDRDSLTKWNELVKHSCVVQSRTQTMFVDAGEDTTAVLSIFDPADPGNALLTVAHAVNGYDVIYGIDIAARDSN